MRASPSSSGQPGAIGPLQRQRQQQLEAGGAGSDSENGVCLASSSTGVWSEHSASMRPSASPGEGLAVALAAQRRDEVAVGVEVADVHVAQVHMVDRHVAGHVHAVRARLVDEREAGGEDRRVMCRRAPVSGELEVGVAGATVSAATGMPDRASPYCVAPRRRGRGPPRQEGRQRLQPDAEAEGGGVLQRAHQHGVVDHRHVGLREGDAAGLDQLGHLGQALALRPMVSAPTG